MGISDLLLTEFDAEVDKTRKTLAPSPGRQGRLRPSHVKSMALGKLAPHVAQLVRFRP